MKPHAVSDQTSRNIQQMRADGWSYQDIAAVCGVTRDQIRTVLRKPRVGKKRPAHQLAEAAREMLEAGYHAESVRAVFGDVV